MSHGSALIPDALSKTRPTPKKSQDTHMTKASLLPTLYLKITRKYILRSQTAQPNLAAFLFRILSLKGQRVLFFPFQS